jgi:hypothetical protein
MESPIDKADRLGRRRLRLFFVVGLILITQQASFDRILDRIDEPLRTVDIVAVSGWVALVITALAALMTGGAYFHGREVRELLNDELSKANRSRALAGGFVITIVTAVIVFAVSFFKDVSGPEAIHAIVTIGLAGALLRFATLERKADADG